MTTKRVLAMLVFSAVVWACSSRGTVQFADAWIDAGEALRDAADDSAQAQVELTADCAIGGSSVTRTSAYESITDFYYAEFSDPSISPATTQGIFAIECGHLHSAPQRQCDLPDCMYTVPDALDCQVQTPQIEAGRARVLCGTRVSIDSDGPGPGAPAVTEERYSTVRLVVR